jgi:hypothetical protein
MVKSPVGPRNIRPIEPGCVLACQWGGRRIIERGVAQDRRALLIEIGIEIEIEIGEGFDIAAVSDPDFDPDPDPDLDRARSCCTAET